MGEVKTESSGERGEVGEGGDVGDELFRCAPRERAGDDFALAVSTELGHDTTWHGCKVVKDVERLCAPAKCNVLSAGMQSDRRISWVEVTATETLSMSTRRSVSCKIKVGILLMLIVRRRVAGTTRERARVTRRAVARLYNT